MKIKKATTKDFKLIVQISINSNDPLNKILPKSKSQLLHLLKNNIKKRTEFFIYDNKGVIGFKRDFPGYKNCEMRWLEVDEKYQNQGIGKKLIKFIENYSKKLGYKGIYLYTHPIHRKAIKFYKNLGYKKINEFPDYYSNRDKSLLFGKKLK